jgi:hypothetical protein
LQCLAPKITSQIPPVSTGAAPAVQTRVFLQEEQRIQLAHNKKITHREKADTNSWRLTNTRTEYENTPREKRRCSAGFKTDVHLGPMPDAPAAAPPWRARNPCTCGLTWSTRTQSRRTNTATPSALHGKGGDHENQMKSDSKHHESTPKFAQLKFT